MTRWSPAAGVVLRVDGTPMTCAAGATVAAAMLTAGITGFRRSVNGSPRGPVCGMGVCYECRVTIDGVPHQRACMVPVQDGMDVRTHD